MISDAFRRGGDRTVSLSREQRVERYRESSSRSWIKVGPAWSACSDQFFCRCALETPSCARRLASFLAEAPNHLALRSGTGLPPNGDPYGLARSHSHSSTSHRRGITDASSPSASPPSKVLTSPWQSPHLHFGRSTDKHSCQRPMRQFARSTGSVDETKEPPRMDNVCLSTRES